VISRRVLELVEALKKRDLRIARSEVDDALRALDAVGAAAFSGRAEFRAVLKCTLCKNAFDVDVFDRVFDLVFGDARDLPRAPPSSLSRDQLQLAFAAGLGGDPLRESLAQSLIDGDEAGLRQSLRAGLDELELTQLSSPLQAGWYTGRLLARLGLDDLMAAARAAADDAAAPALQAIEDRVRRAARRLVEQEEQKRSGRSSSSSPLDRDLRVLDTQQTDEARALLQKLAQKLRARVLRRRRRSRRGRLDVRKTLRKSLQTDGVPLRPVLRRRRADKPALLLLCDVSDSVRASALFLLELCAVLSDLFATTRAFVFVDRLHEVTGLLAAGGAAAVAADDSVMGGGNSDYGRAFGDIDVDSVTRKTVVVVLGDGRSNYRDAGLDVAVELKARAKSVVWLVPEDRGTWGFGDSVIPRYARHADAMLPARTLRDLHKAIDRVLR
jgi:uncharacterized protein with von Willebrand factor type A (vWA) domain